MSTMKSYKKYGGLFAIGALTLGLAACGDDNGENENGENGGDNGEVEETENAEAAVVSAAEAFTAEASSVGITDEVWEVMQADDAEYDDFSELDEDHANAFVDSYGSIVEEHFAHVDDASDFEENSDEYLTTFVVAAFNSDQMEEDLGMVMGEFSFYDDYVTITDNTAVADGFLMDLVRQTAEQYSGLNDEAEDLIAMDDEEMIEEMEAQGVIQDLTLPFSFEEVDGEWLVDGDATARELETTMGIGQTQPQPDDQEIEDGLGEDTDPEVEEDDLGAEQDVEDPFDD